MTSSSSSIPVSLRRLLPQASFVGCGDIAVRSATDRSSDCRPGDLFAALVGSRTNGKRFVADAVDRGACAVLADEPLQGLRVPQCVVPHARAAYARLHHELAGAPSRRLATIGVTGTNGKTTVSWLIRSILERAGLRTGLIGTVEYSDGLISEPATLTTPGPAEFNAWLAAMVAKRTTHVAAEISSHALAQDRVAGVQLDAAVLTNVTQDHLDYHQSFAEYRAAKFRIFSHVKRGGMCVINADDPLATSLLSVLPDHVQYCTFGSEHDAHVTAIIKHTTKHGNEFRMTAGIESVNVHSHLVGRHNVSNCLAAAAVCRHFGLSLAQIAKGIAEAELVPGRLEPVDAGQPFSVLVDYAHTDDALRRVLSTVRSITRGKVICVFGAGGDRDQSKRPLLGEAATAADLAVITSDNPRTENPSEIIEHIRYGCRETSVHIEPNRKDAIRWALSQAEPGDCVLVAGKGHETVQIVGNKRFPFDDRRACLELLQELRSGSSWASLECAQV